MAGKDVDAFVEIDDIVGLSKDPAAMEADIDLDKLILDHQKEVRMYPDFSRGAGESWGHFAKRMCVEGHTFFDAWLIAAGSIGQVMMTTPNAWYLMGLIPGAFMIVWGFASGPYQQARRDNASRSKHGSKQLLDRFNQTTQYFFGFRRC